jgi:cytochrome c-type biogenesis protein CcmH
VRGLKIAALLTAALLAMGAATSNDPAERLPDPVKEAKARALFREVRCLECQNESIDDSEAPIASDLRRTVRQQVMAGRSDAEIKRYLVDRYGEFVLMRPSFSLGNALLWLTPFVIVLGGGAVLILRARGAPPPVAPLSAAEQRALADLDIAGTGTADHASAADAPQEKPRGKRKAPEEGTSVRRQGT